MRVDAAAGRNLAVGLGDLALHVLELRDAQGKRKRHIDISRNERQHRRRWILDNRVVDAVEIRQPRFPVTRVARDPDRLVLLELDEFEGASADRVLSHLRRRHMAGVYRREAAGQHHQECRLRALQMKRHRVVAIGGDPVEIFVQGFARIKAELLFPGLHHQIPGAQDVLGGERLAVMPFDALTQMEGECGAVLAPRPVGRQIGYDCVEPVLLLMLIEQNKIVEHAHHRALRTRGRLFEDRHRRRAVEIVHLEDAAAFLGGAALR